MSTAAVAEASSNAQSAQDVQNVLAELKADSKPETAAASAGVENGSIVEASNIEESAKPPETNGSDEKSGSNDDLSSQKEDDGKKEKKVEATKGDKVEHPRGHRPHRGGGRGRGGFKPYKHNIKSNLIAQEETDDPDQIRKQVEFYFSDSNLPMDKFLLSQVGGSKNLSVDLKIIHSFKRMRHFQPFSAISAALKDSTFLEMTDDDTKVKRKEPLPDRVDPEKMDPDSIKIFEDRAMPRSVYVKGFGEEDSRTQFDIEAFFTPYGPWNAIRLRRAHDKVFKGSVFVEFDSEKTQEKFLNVDPKPEYKGKDLQTMSKKAYCDKKVEDIRSGKVKPNGREPYRGRGGHHNKRKHDDEDDRDWRQRREDDHKNGFRDSRGGGRGGRGRGRDSRRDKGSEIKRDARGVPVVASTETPKDDNSRAKREAATADALAKAKAMVEAENKKIEPEAETKQEDANAGLKEEAEVKAGAGLKGEAQVEAEARADATADSNTEKPANPTSKKRARDETEDDSALLPEAKKVDSKGGVEAEAQDSTESR